VTDAPELPFDECAPDSDDAQNTMAKRFRGFLPVVVDVETGGFNPRTDALLEIAAVPIELLPDGTFTPGPTWRYHVKPFEGANMEPASLEVNGIDPYHPLRPALPEHDALQRIFREVGTEGRDQGCIRAPLSRHNAFFDLHFLNAAIERCDIKRNPFHPFSSFDTATLGGIAYGQTVLSRIVEAAGLAWDSEAAHSAAYDARITAEVFCAIVNQFREIYERTKKGRGPVGTAPS
jgi:ribonuclease T